MLYSGLNKVQLNEQQLNFCYFPTYVSTSHNKEISLQFAKHNGMLMQINKDVVNTFICCSVEWISKFDYECEILIARSKDYSMDATRMNIMDYNYI